MFINSDTIVSIFYIGVTMAQSILTTREKIRQAAQKLFASQGIDNTSVENIIQEAHTSRKTFYQYFSSKMDVLRSFQELKQGSDFQGFFQTRVPYFFELSTDARKELFFKACFEFLQNAQEMDLIFIQVLQREEYLKLLDIDVQNLYQRNIDFVSNFFAEIGIQHPMKRAQLFLFFFDGILLNKSIFSQYHINFPYHEWLENSWQELMQFFGIKFP